MTPLEILSLPVEEMESAIQSYGEQIFNDTRKMHERYINHFSDFVNAYKAIRQAQKEGRTEDARALVRALDERAENLFNA
jgi:hypothetical protein